MTYDGWLAAHPYLAQVADLHRIVDTAAAEASTSTAPIPDWNAYVEEYHAGVPLLLSSSAAIDLSGAQMDLACLAASLTSKPLPGALAWEARTLNADLGRDSETPRRAVVWLLEGDSCPCATPGQGSGQAPDALLRPLPFPMALPENGLSFLRERRRSSACSGRSRGRSR